jgi:hypothetical protein
MGFIDYSTRYIHVRHRVQWDDVKQEVGPETKGGITIAYNQRSEGENSTISVGLSFCGFRDNFHKEVGRIIAEDRLLALPLDFEVTGQRIRSKLEVFYLVKRCLIQHCEHESAWINVDHPSGNNIKRVRMPVIELNENRAFAQHDPPAWDLQDHWLHKIPKRAGEYMQLAWMGRDMNNRRPEGPWI